MNTLVEEYRETIRDIYGDEVANNLDVEIIDGWYYVNFKVTPAIEGESWTNQPARYRKTQLQKTITNLRAKAR
jgi:hypothetical protein